MIWSPFERILWGLVLAIYFFSGLLYLKRGKERENTSERIIIYGFAIFMFCFVFFVIFLLSADQLIPGEFKLNIFYGDYGNVDILYEILMKLAWISYYAGFLCNFLTIEFGLKRTKFIPTTISIVSILTYILLPLDIINTLMINRLILSLNGILWYIIIIIFIRQSRSEFITIGSYFLTAATFEAFGISFGVQQVKQFNLLPIWLAPLFCCIGGFFFIFPLLVNPEVFLRNRAYWLTTSVFTLAIVLTFLFFVIFFGLPPENVAQIMLSVVILIYVQFFYFKRMKTHSSIRTTLDVSKKSSNVLKTFIKPEKITEQEITFHKEKKICLVCKGSLGRFTFLCPECNAFYCENCARTLSDLENACWICNTPFDGSKPSKPYEKEEEEKITVDESVLKERKRENIK